MPHPVYPCADVSSVDYQPLARLGTANKKAAEFVIDRLN
jgi:hypothetical protein